MNALVRFYSSIVTILQRGEWILPTLARFLFAAVLAVYFWISGLTKVGEGMLGIFQPSLGAYAQIFPRIMEQIGYDVSTLR